MKKSLVDWENSSSESERSKHTEDASLIVVKKDEKIFNQMFEFMANSDDVDESDDEVTLFDFKQNLHILSVKKLRKLVVILIGSITE